jgi:hypothetical protein
LSTAAAAAAVAAVAAALWLGASAAGCGSKSDVGDGAAPRDGAAAPSARPVAKLDSVSGAVEHRAGDAVAFESAHAGLNLRANDVLKTGTDGFATVAFTEGGTLDVEPRSLVVIEGPRADPGETSHVLHLDVKEGVVRGAVGGGEGAAPALAVSVGAGEYARLEAEPGTGGAGGAATFRVTAKPSGAPDVAVTSGAGVVVKGKARVHVGALEAVDLGGLRAGSAGAVSLPPFPAALAPAVDATVHLGKRGSVPLRWKEVGAAAGYHVQVASDISFRALLVDAEVKEGRYEFRPSAPGVYAWRVATRGADGRESEFGFARRLHAVK